LGLGMVFLSVKSLSEKLLRGPSASEETVDKAAKGAILVNRATEGSAVYADCSHAKASGGFKTVSYVHAISLSTECTKTTILKDPDQAEPQVDRGFCFLML